MIINTTLYLWLVHIVSQLEWRQCVAYLYYIYFLFICISSVHAYRICVRSPLGCRLFSERVNSVSGMYFSSQSVGRYKWSAVQRTEQLATHHFTMILCSLFVSFVCLSCFFIHSILTIPFHFWAVHQPKMFVYH